MKIVPLILAGGVGSRLWPLSREALPKQFLSLADEKTMLQNTYLRAQLSDEEIGQVMVVGNQAYRFLIAEQMLAMGAQSTIMLEPAGKNTAPAIAVAAFKQVLAKEEALLLVMPADHIIQQVDVFHEKVKAAKKVAEQGFLVTFGICPHYPATEYGYIQASQAILDTDGLRVTQFVEKPNYQTAQAYLETNTYFWNSGMFLFKASVYLNELKRLAPDMHEACQQAVLKGVVDLDFFRLDKTSFESCPSESIDYLIMEKTTLGAMVPLDACWSDIGSWNALCDVTTKDEFSNTLIGDVIQIKTENTYLRSEGRLLAAVGIKDSIVIETSDAVLVLAKEHAKEIKHIVAQLNERGRSETKLHRRVCRPWGWYETLVEAPGFKVKEIMVNPGAALSLQLHHQRSEHWVVVSGTAMVECGEEKSTLNLGESTYIPVNTKHRLANESKEALHLIEVQCGVYLGEDDIVRFSDQYGRVSS